MSNIINVAVIGAGGKMGTHVTNNLAKHTDIIGLTLCETSEKGIQSVRERGFNVIETSLAVSSSDVIILTIPYSLIKLVSEEIVSIMRTDTTLIILDPAAAIAKELYLRNDCTFVVTHPCHPSYFLDQNTPQARADMFGGMGGKQDIVMVLIQGKEEKLYMTRKDFEIMFVPIVNSYILTVNDIAFLEPMLVELLGATCLYTMS